EGARRRSRVQGYREVLRELVRRRAAAALDQVEGQRGRSHGGLRLRLDSHLVSDRLHALRGAAEIGNPAARQGVWAVQPGIRGGNDDVGDEGRAGCRARDVRVAGGDTDRHGGVADDAVRAYLQPGGQQAVAGEVGRSGGRAGAGVRNDLE